MRCVWYTGCEWCDASLTCFFCGEEALFVYEMLLCEHHAWEALAGFLTVV